LSIWVIPKSVVWKSIHVLHMDLSYKTLLKQHYEVKRPKGD
jgi:hypothetical protein